MTDLRADGTRDGDLDEDRLPWLEAVEEEERGPSPVKLIAMVVIGLIAIGVLVGGLVWLGNRGSGGGAGEEIIASPGDYKVPAPEPGGMKVDNSSSSQVATSDGTDQTSSVNQGARPEAPVNQPQQPQPQPQAPAAQPKAAPAPAQPQQPRAQPQAQAQRLSGPTIQVGAYDSQERAEAEWRRLSQRFSYLGALPHAVTTYQRGGKTYYRLRAAGGNASAVCARLRSARQPCYDVNE